MGLPRRVLEELDTLDLWTCDVRVLGMAVDDSLRVVMNSWAREEPATREQANEVARARMALAYLVVRAR